MKASIGFAKRSSTLFVGGSTCCGQAGSGLRAEKIRLCLDCGDYLIYSGPTFAPSHALTATCIGLSLVRKNGQTGRPKRLNKDRCNRSRPGALLVRNGSGQEIDFRRRLRFANSTFNLMTIPKKRAWTTHMAASTRVHGGANGCNANSPESDSYSHAVEFTPRL